MKKLAQQLKSLLRLELYIVHQKETAKTIEAYQAASAQILEEHASFLKSQGRYGTNVPRNSCGYHLRAGEVRRSRGAR
jgi:hypothetical protein